MNELNVFGMAPQDAIFNPVTPFAIRLNCQAGQLALTETDFLGKEAEISIIKIGRYFGSLGKTSGSEWLQVFYVAAPGSNVIPAKDTVCVSYVKTRSLSRFNQLVTQLLGNGQNPATGIFKISFEKHGGTNANGELTSYYSVNFDWRERKGAAEEKQLEKIAAFMADKPQIVDLNSTRGMINIEGLDPVVVAQLQEVSQFEENRRKPVSELMQIVAAHQQQALPAAS